MATPSSHGPRRILIVRPSALGDVCRTVPVLVSLKRAWPDAQVDWLVQDSFAEAIAGHPDLAHIVPFRRRDLARWYRPRGARLACGLLRSLRAARYDLVLDCQGLARSGLLARVTGAPCRIGHADAREGAWLAYSRRVGANNSGTRPIHTVDRMLELVEAAGAPAVRDLRLYPPAHDVAAVSADARLAEAGGLVVIAPTSRWPGKRWPAERFAELARGLLEAPGGAGAGLIALVGGAGERDQCAPLLELARDEPRIIDLIGTTSVGRLLAVIARARLVIACDSAALHMAVGLDRPIVGLFGPTDVAKVGPYRRDADVIQHVAPGERLDHKDDALGALLMARIRTAEVLERALGALGRAPTNQAPAAGTPAERA